MCAVFVDRVLRCGQHAEQPLVEGLHVCDGQYAPMASTATPARLNEADAMQHDATNLAQHGDNAVRLLALEVLADGEPDLVVERRPVVQTDDARPALCIAICRGYIQVPRTNLERLAVRIAQDPGLDNGKVVRLPLLVLRRCPRDGRQINKSHLLVDKHGQPERDVNRRPGGQVGRVACPLPPVSSPQPRASSPTAQ